MTATVVGGSDGADELVERLCRGDEQALNEAYVLHGRRVLAAARRVLIDSRAAEDVSQEVFVYLWRNAARVDLTRGSLGTFLAMLARQFAIGHLRRETSWHLRHERLARRSHPGDWELGEDIADVVVADAAAAQRAGAVRRAVRRLPDEQRTVVELAYFGGRTFRQVAIDTDVPEGTAKSRLRLARRRLERELSVSTASAPAVNPSRSAS